MKHTGNSPWTAVYTGLALVAFAGNSVLCRMALDGEAIDAASFTTIRLLSGAIALWLITIFLKNRDSGCPENQNGWLSVTTLFLYAVTFSFAYVNLNTGTGALILFGAVQATMVAAALFSGERPHRMEWLGLAAALAGLVYLLFPGLTAPSLTGSVLMTVAGISWGIYSLLGRRIANPLAATARNFMRTLPLTLLVSIIAVRDIHLSADGIVLAVFSGALASGMGYAIWYAAMSGLTATRAATVQLSVPLLAAAGGVIFLSEGITLRLFVSAVMILGGVGLAIVGRESQSVSDL